MGGVSKKIGRKFKSAREIRKLPVANCVGNLPVKFEFARGNLHKSARGIYTFTCGNFQKSAREKLKLPVANHESKKFHGI